MSKQNPNQLQQVNSDLVEISGKYLTFELNREFYGIPILKVREIIGLMPITGVPQTPEFTKGVINLRGKVIPVVDLRLKFSMPQAEYNSETCIIVVDIDQVMLGIIVDRVSEVLDVSPDQLEATPHFGSAVRTEFILGLAKTEDQVYILLDINDVMNSEELVMLHEQTDLLEETAENQ